ncbi:MAG: hypothetical protein HYT73_03065 [Candidatus Aenigmarchaeota archaeon]|nr:hypothetical protein [Candidatus Aenigmarchaeota archaeon]
MKSIRIVAILVMLAVPFALAQQMNSSSFKITSDTADSSGGIRNSSSYSMQSSLNSISGSLNSSGFSMTAGFISTLALSVNAPNVLNQTVSGSNWNQPVNFTVLTRDVDNDTVTVSFYTSNDNSSFTLQSTATCAQCFGYTKFNFSISNYVCSDISTKYFKFTASDGSLNNETGPLNFSVAKASIPQSNITVVEGAGQSINTHSTINLTFRIYDPYNGTPAAGKNASIYVQNVGSFNKLSCITNSTGHCRVQLTPACDYSGGPHTLIGGVSGDSCYADINSTSSTFTIDALAFCSRISFKLAFDINGSSGDTSRADGKAAGFYRADNITKHYACIDDGNNAFGIIRTGAQLDYVNATTGSIIVSETQEDNRFAIPVLGSACSLLETKGLSHPLQPFISTNEGVGAVELVLEYPGIDIVGDTERSGSFTLVMERNQSNDKQLIIDIL